MECQIKVYEDRVKINGSKRGTFMIVRYKLNDAIPMSGHIKGEIMEVFLTDYDEVKDFIYTHDSEVYEYHYDRNKPDKLLEYIYTYNVDYLGTKSVPYDILKQVFIDEGHYVKKDETTGEEYVYGLKYVSKDNQDMWKTNTYQKGKEYWYKEIDYYNDYPSRKTNPNIISKCEQMYTSYNRHPTAGLWSCLCSYKNFEDKSAETEAKPIIVRYELNGAIPIDDEIKGVHLEVIATERKEVEEFLKARSS